MTDTKILPFKAKEKPDWFDAGTLTVSDTDPDIDLSSHTLSPLFFDLTKPLKMSMSFVYMLNDFNYIIYSKMDETDHDMMKRCLLEVLRDPSSKELEAELEHLVPGLYEKALEAMRLYIIFK